MPPDFVARLSSRASVPGEVRSTWGIAEYVAGLDRPRLVDPVETPDRSRLVEPVETLERSRVVEPVETPDRPRLVEPVETLERSRVVEPVETFRTADVGRLDRDRLRALLRAMARPPSAELNKTRLAAAAGIPPTTLSPYVDMLARLGVIHLLPGTRSSVAKRAIGRPRVVFYDATLARRLSGTTAADLVQMSGRARLAPLLEGWVIAELTRQQATSAVDFRLAHLRERNGLAVDLLVELADDTLYGVEIRTAAGFRPHQFRSLEALAARAGSRFRGGIVLNTAPVGFKYRPGLWALPISAVWDWS